MSMAAHHSGNLARLRMPSAARRLLPLLRRILPRRVKRWLTRLWDPHRVLVPADVRWTSPPPRVELPARASYPLVSVIVVTWNNLDLTRICIESLQRNAGWPGWELIVVDNASTDGTRAYLQDAQGAVILNEENRGFAAANNQGLAAARGERIILLNNDTIVPPGLIGALMGHLDDPAIGMVNAVTNFSGNESKIDVDYATVEGLEAFALRRMREHAGQRFDIRVAAMYCVALRRDTFERVGPLDERFGIGMFEDDDYSHRVRKAGLRVVCAEDAFVHHFGRASFAKLGGAEYEALFEENRRRYEEKWQTAWQPHKGR